MGLEETFGKVEKPAEEKKIKVIESYGSLQDKVLVELLDYFEQIKVKTQASPFLRHAFHSYKEHLEKLRITPQTIYKFVEKVEFPQGKWVDWKLGIFLCSLVQVSYEQGFNNFEFDEIEAHGFGRFLLGTKENPIRINANTIKGWEALRDANHCILKVKILGGIECFTRAYSCIVEIDNWDGAKFGEFMKCCKIYSSNEKTLERLEKGINLHSYKQVNEFIYGSIQEDKEKNQIN